MYFKNISRNIQTTCYVSVSTRSIFNVPESLIPRDVNTMRIFNLGRVSTRLRHSVAFRFVPRLMWLVLWEQKLSTKFLYIPFHYWKNVDQRVLVLVTFSCKGLNSNAYNVWKLSFMVNIFILINSLIQRLGGLRTITEEVLSVYL